MKTNNTEPTEPRWIPLSERKPTEADEHNGWVHFGRYDIFGQWQTDRAGHAYEGKNEFTHWLPGTLPPPPPREKTQAEKDHNAFVDWWNPLRRYQSSEEVWHAALAYERREIRAMFSTPAVTSLQSLADEMGEDFGGPTTAKAIRDLHARLTTTQQGEGKQ